MLVYQRVSLSKERGRHLRRKLRFGAVSSGRAKCHSLLLWHHRRWKDLHNVPSKMWSHGTQSDIWNMDNMDGTFIEHNMKTKNRNTHTITHIFRYVYIYNLFLWCSQMFASFFARVRWEQCAGIADSDVPGTALQEPTAWRNEWSVRSSGRPGMASSGLVFWRQIGGSEARLGGVRLLVIHWNPLESTGIHWAWQSSWGQCDHLGIHAGIPREHQRTSENVIVNASWCPHPKTHKGNERQMFSSASCTGWSSTTTIWLICCVPSIGRVKFLAHFSFAWFSAGFLMKRIGILLWSLYLNSGRQNPTLSLRLDKSGSVQVEPLLFCCLGHDIYIYLSSL